MTDEQQRVAAFRQAFDAVHSTIPTVVDCDTRTLRRGSCEKNSSWLSNTLDEPD